VRLRFAYLCINVAMLCCLVISLEKEAYAYIDPGSGLFTFQTVCIFFAGILYSIRRRINAMILRSTPIETAPTDPVTQMGKPNPVPLSQRLGEIASSLRRNSILRTIVVALGFCSIYLYRIIVAGTDSIVTPDTIYHWGGNPRTFFVPIALNVLVGWFFLSVLLLGARRPGRLRVAIWSALLLIIPWVVRNNLRLDLLTRDTPLLDHMLLFAAFVLTALLIMLWRPTLASRFERFITYASVVLFFIGLSEIFLLGKLTVYACEASLRPSALPIHHAATGSTIQLHRIIWIVMDELSYKQVYGQRFPGLELPAFDAIAAQSTVFTHALPPDINTEVVMPGLLVGKSFNGIRTPLNGKLWIRSEHDSTWDRFDEHDTVFQDARDAGYSTAVAGWYNPYCRLMPNVLDQCFWASHSITLNGMSPAGTVLSNTLAPSGNAFELIASIIFDRRRIYLQNLLDVPRREVRWASVHIQDYQLLNDASNKLLSDPSAGFVLLHLPIPHPRGIYNRRTGKFSTSTTSYIDNLALADKCLAGMRAALEQNGQWDSSTVLIMGDHSWRAMSWRDPKYAHTYAWTAEDEAASHGGLFDIRPVYIVKLPGQTIEAHVDSAYSTINTRKLFNALFSHKINSVSDLTAWAATMH
jgi:hypothetical protein